MAVFGGRRGWPVVVAVIAVAAVIIAAVVVHYAYTSTPLASVTVEGGTVELSEGQDDGQYWFSPQVQQIGGASDGYPITLPAGGTFTLGVGLTNQDSVAHNLTALSVASPFALLNQSLAFPAEIPSGNDIYLHLTLRAPATAGTYSFSVDIAATE